MAAERSTPAPGRVSADPHAASPENAPGGKDACAAAARTRVARLATVLLVGAIACAFAAQLAALAAHRLDYPINDDWRYYLRHESGLYEMPARLTSAWLLAPAQDTLHLTGKVLDWIVLRLVSHDWSVLAVASFAFAVGGWLWFAVRLVLAAAGGDVVARLAGLALFALPLAGNPYFVALSPFQWLEPAIAYHQLLPVFGLAAIADAVVRGPSGRGSTALRDGLLAIVTLFFGLAYSSGAFSLATFGATAFALARLRPSAGRAALEHLRSDAGIVLVASAACLVLHVVVPTLVFQRNPVTTTRSFDPTWPWTPLFWHYLFGLFDRAVLATSIGPLGLARGAVVLAAYVAPIAMLARTSLTGRLDDDRARRAIPVVACCVAVLAYAFVVAYGRAAFGEQYVPWVPEVAPEIYARSRFFYWWISAALPLVAVAWALALAPLVPRRVAAAVLALFCAFALAPKPQHEESRIGYLGHWRYTDLYAHDAELLARVIALDVAHARTRTRPDPNRAGLSREERFREQRWFRRVGQSPRLLVRDAEEQHARFVDRWQVYFR